MTVECLIIEDNQKVVDIIKTVGIEYPQILFSSIGENQEAALNAILIKKPDIVFINMEADKINFLEFLLEIALCEDFKPRFIALSTSEKDAFNAYKYNFQLFLLKPLNEFTIRKCLLKTLKVQPLKEIESICLKSHKDYHYLDISNILYLKADNNTTDFYMADGRVVSAFKTLKVFEKSLPKTFYRIHKSYIININCISRIHYGKSMCIIKNQHKIPFTKTFLENIKKINKVLSSKALFTLN
jgi:DNA-binding LytR/AlgR family response regulator